MGILCGEGGLGKLTLKRPQIYTQAESLSQGLIQRPMEQWKLLGSSIEL